MATATVVKPLTKAQVQEVLSLLDSGEENSNKIAQALDVRTMQVAAVKAWRTMGAYEGK